MSDWKSASLDAVIPSELVSIAATAQGITSAVSGLLSIVKTAIDISRPVAGFPNVDFASLLLEAVESFKSDFLGAGFYMCSMWDYPLRQYYRSGSIQEGFVESFQTDLVNSLSDPFDPNVPTFSGDCAMLVLAGGTSGALSSIINVIATIGDAFPTWGDIGAAYDQMRKKVWTDLIDNAVENLESGVLSYSDAVSQQSAQLKRLLKAQWDALENLSADDLTDVLASPLETLADVDSFIDNVNARVASARYPDWESTTLRKVLPPLSGLIDQALQPLVDALQSGSGIITAIDEFLEVIDFKIAQLQALIDKIDEFLTALQAIASLGGLHAIYITSSTGIAGLAQELQFAGNPPFEGDTGYFFGAAFLAGGPSLAPFENLFSGVGS